MNEIIFYGCIVLWDGGVAWTVTMLFLELLHAEAIVFSHSQYPNKMLAGQKQKQLLIKFYCKLNCLCYGK